MITLIVLAFNEENNIKTTIDSYIDEFQQIILVNDGSTDGTSEIINSFHYENLKILEHESNKGAGMAFESGINEFLKLDSNYLIKIDGDNQFKKDDVINIKKILENKHFDYIKCDRFWSGGIIGKIPFIRYFGNALASLLIKICSGNWSLNDPLNGLIAMSKEAALVIEFPKKFYKYGYPFFIANKLCQLNNINQFKIGQFKNVVTYGNEKSYLRPLNMFIKLISFTTVNYFSKIKIKMKFSEYQFSSILDISSTIFLVISFFSLNKFFSIRYFEVDGPQSSWFILFIIFFLLFTFLATISQRIENKISKIFFQDIN